MRMMVCHARRHLRRCGGLVWFLDAMLVCTSFIATRHFGGSNNNWYEELKQAIQLDTIEHCKSDGGELGMGYM